MFQQYLLEISYLLASALFVVGLKMLGNPKTARQGNLLAAVGMALAIVGTMFLHKDEAGQAIGNYGWILAAIVLGSVVGTLSAKKVKMTAMPQMVSLFNGMGGACAALISMVEFNHLSAHAGASVGTLLSILAGLVIGTVSFSGSMVAFLKLQEIMKKTLRLPGHQLISIGLLVSIMGLCVYMGFGGGGLVIFYVIALLSLLYGILFVVPIGGADMPVVISLLNSFTGLAAAFGGFLYDNQVMLTGGILVGSAGTLLTVVMCNAMNRSLTNVLFGSMGGGAATAEAATSGGGAIKPTTPADTAILLNYAKSVIVVPGYGLAVAQAQQVIHEMEMLLQKQGVEVRYAIHPVAGRMPGHMNVLLAEANVEYDKLVDMEAINDDFANTDVVLVIGANDVVNPAARNNPASPIFGMPILNADKARTVIVSKRSMAAGYAGIDNELFGYPNCLMLFGDAKASLTKVVGELKEM
jgi:H+-translocating NAD(P) transhydrogenase subunit beta